MKIRYFIDKETLCCKVLGGLINNTTGLLEIEDKDLYTKYYNLKTIEDRRKFLENNNIDIALSDEERIDFINDLSSGTWSDNVFNISSKEDLIIICKALSNNFKLKIKDLEEYLDIIDKHDEELKKLSDNCKKDTDQLLGVIEKLLSDYSKFQWAAIIESVIIVILTIILFL